MKEREDDKLTRIQANLSFKVEYEIRRLSCLLKKLNELTLELDNQLVELTLCCDCQGKMVVKERK
jgi:division protein CdvB (Snf7/Vps24/ESCRT-III family)